MVFRTQLKNFMSSGEGGRGEIHPNMIFPSLNLPEPGIQLFMEEVAYELGLGRISKEER
jgi:hypothetical protein